jgi:hypothetical protein
LPFLETSLLPAASVRPPSSVQRRGGIGHGEEKATVADGKEYLAVVWLVMERCMLMPYC